MKSKNRGEISNTQSPILEQKSHVILKKYVAANGKERNKSLNFGHVWSDGLQWKHVTRPSMADHSRHQKGTVDKGIVNSIGNDEISSTKKVLEKKKNNQF